MRCCATGALYEQVALELGDVIGNVHGHLPGGAGETATAECKTMHADTRLFQRRAARG